MDWIGLLSKLRIVDIKVKPEAEQMGVINIQIENKTYNYNFSDPKAIEYVLGNPSAAAKLEGRIKADAKEHLASIDISLGLVSEQSTAEILAATTATSTVTVIKKM
jgi:hypothetical protein